MKLDNLASEGAKITAPMAVYHYSASVSRQFHGPEHYDGVITCPVISGPDDYDRAIELIAAKSNAQHTYQVQVNSLSFVGETPAPQPPEHHDSFIGPAGQTDEVITWPQRKVVITATRETAGDARFWPLIVDAIKECGEEDPMGCEDDFISTYGVRLRFSWPKRFTQD